MFFLVGGPGVNKAGKKSTNEVLSSSTFEMKRPAMTAIRDESKNNIVLDETMTKVYLSKNTVNNTQNYSVLVPLFNSQGSNRIFCLF